MDKHGDHSFDSVEDTDLEEDESSTKSTRNKVDDPKLRAKFLGQTNNRSPWRRARAFLRHGLTHFFVMGPLTIITNVLAASRIVNGSACLAAISFGHRFFPVVVMVHFYASISGMILWYISPVVALTMSFGAVLPSELNGLPRILMMGLAALMVSMLLVHETFPGRK